MIKNADRYTMLTMHPNDLAEKMKQSQELGLCYFVMNSHQKGMCNLFLFFDENGRDNYLTHVWGNALAQVREFLYNERMAGTEAKKIVLELSHMLGVVVSDED